ncbi:hypothetical protein Tco_0883381 [Tanacetum coccineum]
MVEEPVKSMKKKDLVRLDEEIASKLQAEFDEEERLTREKDEANVALTKEWDDIQDKQRRKHFAAKRAEEKRNKPPTQAFKRVNTFVDFRIDLVEVSSKRAGTELEQEVTKKQKVDDVQETAEVDNDQEAVKIKELMKIITDKAKVTIDAIPLAVKPPSIMYLDFSHMLKSIDREDLETLWKLVKAKHGSTRSEEVYERVLWGDLKDATHTDLYLVDKKYHLTPATITNMLNKKLQCDHFSEMAYQLLKLLTKQLKN